MSSEPKIFKSPNKIFLNKSNSIVSTPKFFSSLSVKSNTNSKLKLFNSNSKKSLLSNVKNNFNSNLNINHSFNFLIPFSKNQTSKTTIKKNPNNYTNKKISLSPKKYLFTETKSIQSKFDVNNSLLESNTKSNNFLNKKRKLMTSEEIEMEKIKEEKKIQKKLSEKNRKLYLKSFNYSPMKIIPCPLTTFKPFKLSSNSNSKYLKQGKSNTLYEINKQNQKIRLIMQQKIEKLTDNKSKDRILLNNIEYLKKQNSLYNDLFNANKENYNNNNIFFDESDENKSFNFNENNLTPFKEPIIKWNQKSNLEENIKNKVMNTENKNKNEKNIKILDYLKSLRKNNN